MPFFFSKRTHHSCRLVWIKRHSHVCRVQGEKIIALSVILSSVINCFYASLSAETECIIFRFPCKNETKTGEKVYCGAIFYITSKILYISWPWTYASVPVLDFVHAVVAVLAVELFELIMMERRFPTNSQMYQIIGRTCDSFINVLILMTADQEHVFPWKTLCISVWLWNMHLF